MRAAAIRLTIASILGLCWATSAAAQEEVLTLETSFQGDVTDRVADQLRQALNQGLNETSERPVLSEAQSRERLGAESDRLMACGSDSACLAQAGDASGHGVAIVAMASALGEIYSFAIDIYDLSTGEAIHVADTDCPLCTVEEAQAAFLRLAEGAGTAIPAYAPPVAEAEPEAEPVIEQAAETVMLYVRAEPSAARIAIGGRQIGVGIAEMEVEPGTYPVRVEAVGYQPIEQDVVVAAGGQDQMIQVSLEPERAQPVPSTDGAVVRRGGALEGVDTTALGSVLTGTGLATMVTGIVLLAIDGETTCSGGPSAACPEVYDTAFGGTMLTILGSAAVTAGAMLLLWDTLAGEPERLPDGSSAGLGIGVEPEGAVLVWGGRF